MKIHSVRCRMLQATVPTPLQFGIGAFPTFAATLVEVRTDDGLVGVGECIVRRAPQVTRAVVEHLLAPLLVGRDPQDAEGVWDEMFRQLRGWGHYRGFLLEAISGVDIALWDILGKAAGLPVYKVLQGAGRDRVPCYASSVYFADIEQMVSQAVQQVDAGHTAVKVKIGRPPELGGRRADVESVRAIREAVGPRVDIMLDVNSAYDAATAIAVCRQLADLDIAWIEEPVPPDDLDGYARVRAGQPIPVAAGESEFGVFGFRELIRRGAVDIVQPDVARVGGFTAARRVGALVHAHNLRYAPHTGFSAGVSHLAALHVAASVPNLMTYEYFFAPNPLRDLFTEPFPRPRDGMIDVPRRPGLGLDLDPEVVERFEVR
ncbi:MAG: mandelate racemase/muconate lactonizing enzyme family protein [Armatimonadota bacterium]|nr:mandelate racemase/muconate lactonizing enzyme family protein [Armatimonadota bacterium]MDR7401616.1 mandelate racemase/muconate lactonizing enzyme family protein [Armatimonadota bacterium]MDR7404304.1 mandelate racemase/muconate lactonizing enzyme family protein [Armatimonadota bacterium]MDR7436881.1 mandelate racemase/muconate lactonizing enzyme family protein [Armatimonadota bacterium]MDR7471578.1 mandelate racemase/muconate lactonizing enzyme family protein [Armatimonadota bacterium]